MKKNKTKNTNAPNVLFETIWELFQKDKLSQITLTKTGLYAKNAGVRVNISGLNQVYCGSISADSLESGNKLLELAVKSVIKTNKIGGVKCTR